MNRNLGRTLLLSKPTRLITLFLPQLYQAHCDKSKSINLPMPLLDDQLLDYGQTNFRKSLKAT